MSAPLESERLPICAKHNIECSHYGWGWRCSMCWDEMVAERKRIEMKEQANG